MASMLRVLMLLGLAATCSAAMTKHAATEKLDNTMASIAEMLQKKNAKLVNPAPPPAPPAVASSIESISCGMNVTGSTVGMANVVGSPAGDKLYEFCATTTGNYTFNTCGSNFDTWLHVYPDDDSYELPEASCDDCGGCGVRTVLSADLTAGTCYHVFVDGYSSSEGTYHLDVLCPAPPPAAPAVASSTSSSSVDDPVFYRDKNKSSLTAGLVDIIVAMVKMTGSLSADHKTVVMDLSTKVTDEEIPDVLDDFQQDQDLLDLHAGALGDCDTDLEHASSSVTAMGETQAQLLNEYTACEAERQSILDEKYNASLAFSMWMNSQMPPDNVVPSTTYGDVVEEWILERLMWHAAFNLTYKEYVTNETKVDVEAKLSIANCSGELTVYEMAYCSWEAEIGEVSSVYANCRNETTALYNSTLARVQISEASRITELQSLYKVKCQLEALTLDDAGLNGELDACEGESEADVTQIILTIPTLVAYNADMVTALGTPSANVTC